ncbi:S1C family serine protease [Brooklawnia cerclae]|uniref:S1-C subfamily serine protease n=1 Tax=Brooklawnia cerclae TaxID=349934 RepID=A0ABX0SID4_9ACTN|nr:trypsin-like peptidase domain-containing protein [Brooklawnia cerclae]NIH58160.1 S1-C subfamily serine protease [Brooklawnia cerclae]
MSNQTSATGTTGTPVSPRPPRLSPLRKALIAAAAVIGIAGQVAVWTAPTWSSAIIEALPQVVTASPTPSASSSPSSGTSSSSGASSSAAAAADVSTDAIVLVNTTLTGGTGAGTGMIIDSSGIVLTNYHVVEGTTSVQVTLTDGTTSDATVLGFDASEDVAVLQLDDASGLETVALDEDGVTTGEDVTTIGNANGQGYLSSSAGEIVATDRTVTVDDSTGGSSETLSGMIVTSTAAVPGDSGGPTVDADGEVIGITTAGASSNQTTSSRTGQESTTYVIPIAHAMSVVTSVLDGDEGNGVVIGPRPWLGVSVISASEVRNSGPGGRGTTTTSGATVVSTEGPAAQAGIVSGDTIVAVDGTQITDPTSLSEALLEYQPGDTVTVTVVGSTGTRHVQVTLETSSIN